MHYLGKLNKVHTLGFVLYLVQPLDFCFFLLYVEAPCGQCLWCASGSRFGPALPLWLMILMRQFVKIKTFLFTHVIDHNVCPNYCILPLARTKLNAVLTFIIGLEKRKQIVPFIC